MKVLIKCGCRLGFCYTLEYKKEKKKRHKFHEWSTRTGTCVLLLYKRYSPRNPSADFRSPHPKKMQMFETRFSILKKGVWFFVVVAIGSIWGFWFLLLSHRKQGVSNILTSIAPRRLALSPMLSSMYLLSSSVIVGCFAGLSYETKSQNMYQTIPKLPLEWKERL